MGVSRARTARELAEGRRQELSVVPPPPSVWLYIFLVTHRAARYKSENGSYLKVTSGIL